MSSLLKMNQKFLSKSSWSIRGGGGNSNNNNNNNNAGNSNNRLSTSSSNYRSPASATNKYGINNGIDGGKQTPTSGILHGRPRPSMVNANVTPVSANGRNRPPANNVSNRYSQFDSPINASHQQRNEEKLVIKPSLFSSQNSSSLKNSKGMSHSITDLRELKEKPKKNHNWNDESDEFQHEIKERRIDMYIAEIEMEPLFQLGSTIR